MARDAKEAEMEAKRKAEQKRLNEETEARMKAGLPPVEPVKSEAERVVEAAEAAERAKRAAEAEAARQEQIELMRERLAQRGPAQPRFE